MIRGIATEEQFVYEIILLCLVIPLTSLDALRKIGGIQQTKEKTASAPSADSSHQRQQPTARIHTKRLAASGVLVKQIACPATGGFLMVTANQATFPGFQFPNTTQIPNEVFDTLMPQLSGGELKVLLYICRRTFGFRKDTDRISLSQISKGITTKAGRVLDHGTGLCKRHVINAVKALEKKNIIIITRTVDETGLNAVNTYSLNILDAESGVGKKSPQGVVNSSSLQVVNSPSPGVVNCNAPTKQREQKKEEQKKDIDDDVAHNLENFGMTKPAVTALIERCPAPYITEKLRMTHDLLAEGSALVAKNPVGWLRRAIEEDYKPPRNTRGPTPASGTKSQEHTGIPEEQKKEHNIIITPPRELPQPDSQTEMIWQKTVEHLGEAKTRLTGVMLLEVTDTKAVIFVPNPAVRTWLERRLYQQIRHAIKGVIGMDVDLHFVTNPV
jgi:phage replication O-like protein O